MLRKEEVCVYIENEAQLQEARELLEKYGEEISEDCNAMDFIFWGVPHNILTIHSDGWYLSRFNWRKTKITLQELETILKAEL